jgi:hypothetical protein
MPITREQIEALVSQNIKEGKPAVRKALFEYLNDQKLSRYERMKAVLIVYSVAVQNGLY